MAGQRPRVQWTVLHHRVALRKGPPEERQARATMSLGTIWQRIAIWNATAVLRGSLEPFFHSFMMVMVMVVMMVMTMMVTDGGGGGDDEDDGLMWDGRRGKYDGICTVI